MTSTVSGKALRFARLETKISLLAASATCFTACILVALAAHLSSAYSALALREVNALVDEDLSHVTRSAYNLVRAEDEAIREYVRTSVKVARGIFDRAGGLRFEGGRRFLTAENQFDGSLARFELPRVSLGGMALFPESAAKEQPLVDEVTRLIGASATLFLRANADGDFVRVATTVRRADGRPAVGTYIPAREPDGKPNPVVAALVAGRAYQGRAYVVDAWYLTAYEPIVDAQQEVIGALYVGINQRAAESRIRDAIIDLKLGRSGYVFVITGTGADRGRYVISQGGLRDGEDIWDATDPDGRKVTREIVSAALALDPGEMTTIRYRWINPGEAAPRWKIARLARYAPWDWVIGASVYEDEVDIYRSTLTRGNEALVRTMVFAGLGFALLVGFVGARLARTIAVPIARVTVAAETLARGEAVGHIEPVSGGELGALASAFNCMNERITAALGELRESEANYRGLFENALEGIYRTSFAGRPLAVNPALARMLGYDSAAEFLAQVSDLGNQVYENVSDRALVLDELRARGMVIGRETRLKRKDGSVIWASVSARIVTGRTGGESWIDGFIVDITERKAAAEALEASRAGLARLIAERDALLHEVQHRVKNNLQVLLSLVGLQSSETASADAAHALARFRDRVLVMTLVHEALQRSPDFRSVDVAQLALTLADSLRHPEQGGLSPENAPCVENELPSFRVSADSAMPLALALGEVLSNALTYGRRPGSSRIRIRIYRESEGVEAALIVQDEGPGLAPDFDLMAGAGLGLRIAMAAMAQILGRIETASSSESMRFRLVYPAALEFEPDEPRPPAPPPPDQRGGANIDGDAV